ncbi:MAG: LuxR C-terminal-related transcriptional regulator [Gemmobacter sp.]
MTPLPNLAEVRLAEAIRLIGQPGFEAALLAFLQAVAAPDNLIVLAYRSAGPPLALYRQTDHPQVFAELDRTYLAGAYRLDPFYDLHLRRAPAGAYRIRDIAPDAFQRSRYFIDYYDQTTLVDEVTFVAYPSAAITLNICIGRDASSGAVFLPRDVETCHRIAPVVVAMAEAHWAGLAGATGPAEDTSALLADAARGVHGIHLSPRQAEVALMILRGHSTVSIGLRLGLSAQTVKVFRKQLYARCRISSQAELFALMLPLLTSR